MSKYDKTPTSMDTDGSPAVDHFAREAIVLTNERLKRLQEASAVLGGVATEKAYTDSAELPAEGGVVIQGNFGGAADEVQARLRRLEDEARAQLDAIEGPPSYPAA